jgi:hypothetical protein
MAGQGGQGQTPYTSLGQLALARIRRRLQRGRSQASRWYASVAESDRERLRALGRRLVNLVSEYLARGGRRPRLVEEAREIGREYGRELSQDGLNLRDAVEAFTFFRKGLDDTAMELAQRAHLSAEEAVDVWELLSGLADQVLLAITEAYTEGQRA